MSGQRLRLTTSRPAGYRRGGQVIGGAAAPTFVERDGITASQLLAVALDPNITLAFEIEDSRFERVSDEDRERLIESLREVIELDGPDRTFGDNPDVYNRVPMTDEERAAIEAAVKARFEAPTPPPQPDTAEPQGEGLTPGAEASQASGAVATPTGSDASAGDAATPEPTAQANPAAPEPAAAPKPASRGGGKAKGSPA